MEARETAMKCLDTSLLIDLTRNEPDAVKAVEDAEAEGAVTTEVNAFELYAGAHRNGTPVAREMKAVDDVLRRLEVLPLTRPGSRRAAETAAILRAHGRTVGALDVLIAAIAFVHGITTVVTQNVEDFRRIPGIRVESY